MIYEHRIYTPMPGKMPALLARFRDHVIALMDKHRICHVGFWTTSIGEDSTALTSILAWDSLADRETKWAAFAADPEWIAVRDESERNGPILLKASNQIMRPTDFSALK